MAKFNRHEQESIKILEGIGFTIKPGEGRHHPIDFQGYDSDRLPCVVEAKNLWHMFSTYQVEAFKEHMAKANAYVIVNSTDEHEGYLLFKLVRIRYGGITIETDEWA